MFGWLFGKKHTAKTKKSSAVKEQSSSPQDDNLWRHASNADQAWSQLQKRCEKFAQNGEWGQYATAKKLMAWQLYSEGRMADALGHASAALFLTLNGPYSGGLEDFRKLAALDKYFDEPKPYFWQPDAKGYVDPNIIAPFLQSASAAGLHIDELKDAFVKGCAKFAPKKTGAPLSYDAAWERLTSNTAFIQAVRTYE